MVGLTGFKLSDGDGTGFCVRTGPNYNKNGSKRASARHLYTPVSMDVFERKEMLVDVASSLLLPPPVEGVDSPNPSRLPRRLVVNLIVPSEPPPLLRAPTDGPCYQIVTCFVASAQTLSDWQASGTPAFKLFERFLRECPEGVMPEKGNLDIKERLKILPLIENAKAAGLPSWLEGYNGKPALITKSGAVLRGDDYLLLTINLFRFGLMTKKGMHYLLPRLNEFDLHCGLTLEGREDDELDECVLCAARVSSTQLGLPASMGTDHVLPWARYRPHPARLTSPALYPQL